MLGPSHCGHQPATPTDPDSTATSDHDPQITPFPTNETASSNTPRHSQIHPSIAHKSQSRPRTHRLKKST